MRIAISFLLSFSLAVSANPFFALMASKPPSGMVFSALGSSGNTSGANSYATTATYTPTANALLLAVVVNSKASAPDTPTFSGNGLTWAQVATATYNTVGTPIARITVFRALGASPTTTAGTADFAGVSQTGCHIYVCQLVGANTTGTSGSGAIVQSPSNPVDTTANPSITMSALDASGNNAVVAFVGTSVNSSTYGAAEAGWSEDLDQGYNTPPTGCYVVHRLATVDNTVVVTGASANWCVIAVEVQ